MDIQFYKYHGAGNDFVMIDDRAKSFPADDTELVKKLCSRHTGIGADGLILLQLEDGYDFKMVYYNADGNESSMCGNGGRCILLFAKHLGVIEDAGSFVAIDGPHEGNIAAADATGAAIVKLKMVDVKQTANDGDAFVINTGSPHFVKFIADRNEFEKLDVKQAGAAIRNSAAYKQQGINVNFVYANTGANVVEVKTFERGVEDETLACGTGVVACAIANSLKFAITTNEIEQSVHAVGGNFKVLLEKNGAGFKNIWLIGEAKKVYQGVINSQLL